MYAVGEMAYLHMKLHSQSQSLVVSGESGAGKTEVNKQLMDYLIWRAGTDYVVSADSDKGLAELILDTNPVRRAWPRAHLRAFSARMCCVVIVIIPNCSFSTPNPTPCYVLRFSKRLETLKLPATITRPDSASTSTLNSIPVTKS